MSADAVTLAPRRRALLALMAVVMSGAATACNGSPASESGSSTSSHAAFVTRVDAVCQRAVDAHAGHSFPLPNFDPQQPNPGQLPAVGRYFARYGGLDTVSRELHALKPPSADARSWQALLHLVDQMTANAAKQISAAKAEDVPTFVRTVKVANRLIAQINRSGGRFGFSSESACSQVFG